MDGPEGRDKSRWYPEFPRVGVGVVVIRDGCILMVQRAREPARGKWSIPGGALELGETLAEGARREVLEECSVEVEIEGVMDVTDKIVKDGEGRTRYHFVLVDISGRYAGGEARARSDAAVCRWVAIGEVAGLDLTDTLRDLLKRKGII
jgi:8-oxo-dGTP diphosphatase